MIRGVKATQRLDSSGDPTVQVDLTTDDGTFRALVPAGKSEAPHEFVELKDNDPGVYRGFGVEVAVKNVQEIIGPALVERRFNAQKQLREIDQFMVDLDGTPNLARLGANAVLGVSMACARAGAAAAKMALYEFLWEEAGFTNQYTLPVPFFSALNGGMHSGDVMAFQEILIAPVGAGSFKEAMQIGSELHHKFGQVLAQKFGELSTGVGAEGGFAPPIRKPEDGMNFLENAIHICGYTEKTKFAIHAAAPNFYDKDAQAYDLGFPHKPSRRLTPMEMRELYKRMINEYPIVLLEDPFIEEDWDSWADLTRNCAIEIVGDALIATNPERIKLAHEKKACNAVLLKLNQIGTVSKAIEVAKLSYQLEWSVFVSHRAGEALDDFAADISVALGAGHAKFGAPFGGERISKYNRLLEIEEDLIAKKKIWVYAGQNFRFSGSNDIRQRSRLEAFLKQRC